MVIVPTQADSSLLIFLGLFKKQLRHQNNFLYKSSVRRVKSHLEGLSVTSAMISCSFLDRPNTWGGGHEPENSPKGNVFENRGDSSARTQ